MNPIGRSYKPSWSEVRALARAINAIGQCSSPSSALSPTMGAMNPVGRKSELWLEL